MKKTPQQQLEALELAFLRACKNGERIGSHVTLEQAQVSSRFFYNVFDSFDHFIAYMKKKNPSLVIPPSDIDRKKAEIADLKQMVISTVRPSKSSSKKSKQS